MNDDISSALEAMVRRIKQQAEEGIQEVAMDLLQKSKDLCPVDLGDLKASGFISKEGDKTVVGYTEPYALRQHEELEFNHPNGGQAKFLQQPLEENTDKYIRHVVDKIKLT